MSQIQVLGYDEHVRDEILVFYVGQVASIIIGVGDYMVDEGEDQLQNDVFTVILVLVGDGNDGLGDVLDGVGVYCPGVGEYDIAWRSAEGTIDKGVVVFLLDIFVALEMHGMKAASKHEVR